MTAPRRVCLLIHTSNAWSREVLRGISEFRTTVGDWEVLLEVRGIREKLLLPPKWSGDGVIARIDHPQVAAQLEGTGLPVVNVSRTCPEGLPFGEVLPDEAACGALAAGYFLGLGFRNFAYVDDPHAPGYSGPMHHAFRLGMAGGEVQELETPPLAQVPPYTDVSIRLDTEAWKPWLAAAPKPIAILTLDGMQAMELQYLCLELGLKVPEEVALLPAYCDPLVSSMAPVPLSEIDMAPAQVGFQAADLLERMMRGQESRPQRLRVAPLEIIPRRSTSTFAVQDLLVRRALEFIGAHLAQGVKVGPTADHLGVSRRKLENRFHAVLGQAPGEVIRRQRIELARQLLRQPELKIAAVAERAGYSHRQVLSRAFLEATGEGPLAYRRRILLAAAPGRNSAAGDRGGSSARGARHSGHGR